MRLYHHPLSNRPELLEDEHGGSLAAHDLGDSEDDVGKREGAQGLAG
jgi:hypothetical protein